MPSFPEPGSLTICEINRNLITADSLSDDIAKQTYEKILGLVFSPVSFRLDYAESPERGAETPVSGLEGLIKGVVSYCPLKRIFAPYHALGHAWLEVIGGKEWERKSLVMVG
ncbi:hypothetical protein Tco_1443709 [Tanacetum coccineum]